VPRHDIFGAADAKCLPLNLRSDAETMFAGYVGSGFECDRGILLLAINPGGGRDAYTMRTPEDESFYPLLQTFKAADSRGIVDAFEQINRAFPPIVRAWNLWRILGPTLAAASRSLEQIAYMNIVPYRTRGDRPPPVPACRAAWLRLVVPTLQVLRPRAIVTLGKKAGSVIERFHSGGMHVYCVPRTIGDTRISDEARAVHERMYRELRRA
jgi:hypothetical protein